MKWVPYGPRDDDIALVKDLGPLGGVLTLGVIEMGWDRFVNSLRIWNNNDWEVKKVPPETTISKAKELLIGLIEKQVEKA